MTARLVVVGGDAAGMSCASVARRLAPDLDVVVLEAGQHISYAACGVPMLLSGEVDDPERLIAVTPEQARRDRSIDLRLAHLVEEVDVARRVITGQVVGQGRRFAESFDALVLGTGAHPVVPPLPGIDARGVFVLRQLHHGLAMWKDLKTRAPRRAVVAGAGYVGLDVAEALRKRGLVVTLLHRGRASLLGLEPELGDLVDQALARAGCVVLREAPLYSVESEPGGLVRGVRAGGESIPADLLVVAMGIRPASAIAERAGITLGAGGAIRVDARTQTSAQGIHAAGDCATQRHRVTGAEVYVTQAQAANRQGRVAGANAALALAGRPQGAPLDPGTLGTTVKRVFDVEVGRTGLGLADARAAGLDATVFVVRDHTRARYAPGSAPVRVALVVERGTGRLLGGQVVGGEGAAKRVDVLATALAAGFDVARLADLDLGYAPTFSPVWDPLQVAARVAAKGA